VLGHRSSPDRLTVRHGAMAMLGSEIVDLSQSGNLKVK